MVLGAVWCKTSKVQEASKRIREIKARHRIKTGTEVKWVKTSSKNPQPYLDLIDYFFDDDDLHFRCVLIPDKGVLDHKSYEQTHDSWYYKMVFRLVEPIICPTESYRVYLDIKDTRAWDRSQHLLNVIQSTRRARGRPLAIKIQPIRSHESDLMQICDLLLGAVGYNNRGLATSPGKLAIIERIKKRSGHSLRDTTWLREAKFNMLRWSPEEPGHA